MDNEFNVKNSVNLPKTSFKMKAQLSKNEPKIIEFWDSIGLYGKIIDKNKDKKAYILHDGPPYANGNIHLGHALNKILKDFIVKYKSMKGYFSPYIPGWDCHGLPIEKKMESELGYKQKQMDIIEFRNRCREYARKYVGIQMEQFKRLGVFGDWEKPYLTMDYSYEATISRIFGKFVEMGSVYKGAKPVYWCISCQTALAEAEVEYGDHVSPSVYVKFKTKSDFSKIDPIFRDKNLYVVIWTTTPWTLPANLAIAFHPDFEYVAVDVGNETYIIAEGLLEEFASECGLKLGSIIARFKGAQLEGHVCAHPFMERDSLCVLADYVTLDQGTGCVHTAPGHGQEDYLTGQKYGLPLLCPVDHEGKFTEEVPLYQGKVVFDCNDDIVEMMRNKGVLVHSASFEHSYPHCWRCHNPIVFRSTPQWFISIDKNDLRKKAIEEIHKVKWIPAWGESRITNMVENRPDWCISRQRSWGVPIVAFYCKECGELLLDHKIVEHVSGIFEKEGADAWFKYDPDELLPSETKCPKCGSNKFEKEFDILDVWFDSGVSYEALRRSRVELPWPSNMYLEGGDQYRGWFHSSLLAHLGAKGECPYQEVVTHGWVLDKDGRAMSKSLGNVIEPSEVIKQSGAEILRLWVSSVEYKEDIRISDEILLRLSEAYRKIRNTMRFILGNLKDFNPDNDQIDYESMLEIDKWALAKVAQVIHKCDKAYDQYTFHTVYHTLYQFCTIDLSAVYFDILKDRLYTAGAKSKERRSAQTTLWMILHSVVRLLAPIIPFTTEEVWQHMREIKKLDESVHLTKFPGVPKLWINEELIGRWDKLFEFRDLVSKALEEKRQEGVIGNSLQARIILKAPEKDYEFLSQYIDQLRYIFIVSNVILEKSEVKEPSVNVELAPGEKCERCWNYSTMVGSFKDWPTVCERCIDTVRELARNK